MSDQVSTHRLRSSLRASLAKLRDDIARDAYLDSNAKSEYLDNLQKVMTNIGAQNEDKWTTIGAVANVLDRIVPVFTGPSLQAAKDATKKLQLSYKAASDARKRAIERAAGQITDLEMQHLEERPDISFARPSIDSSATRSSHGSGSGGSSNTSSVQFSSRNRGSYDSLAPQPPPSLYGRHPNPSTKSVNKDSANFTTVHDDGAHPSAQRPRTRSLRSLFPGSTTSLAPSASYPYNQQPQYGGQGHHASAASLVPPVPQMPSLAPGSIYPGATTSPYGPGPNYYPANPSTTMLIPAPGPPYASTQSLQGQYHVPPSDRFNPALMSRESMRNMPEMVPQQLYGQMLDPRDPYFDDPARQHRLINESNQPTPKKERRSKH